MNTPLRTGGPVMTPGQHYRGLPMLSARELAWHGRHPELAAQTGLPIKDIQDLTGSGDYWFACLPADGASPEVLRDQLLKVHGVTI
jgi:hypothetical protein